MQLNSVLLKSSQIVLMTMCVLLLLAIVDRVGTFRFVPWELVWIFSGFVVFASFLTLWTRSSLSVIEVASELDQRAQLHDRVASAITCEQSGQPFCKATVEDAVAVVDSKKIQSRVAEFFPIAIPQKFNWIALAAFFTALILWTPQWGWWNGDDEPTPMISPFVSNENIETSIDAVLDELKSDELLSESLEKEMSELASTNVQESIDTETLRRDALKKITDVQKRLEELMKDENALAYEEMLRRMQALKLPKNSSTQPMVANMKSGNFDQAKKEFEKLQQKLESSELSKEERQELANAMEDLAKQLQKLSKANDSLSSALAAAGLNSNLANNPDAAMKAIQNAKDLTEEQKKQLLKLLKAQQAASKMCKNMGKACKNCAGGKKGNGVLGELAKLSAMSKFKTKAQIAKSACQKAAAGMCATGGKGQGNGGSNATEKNDTTLVAERTPVQTLEGTIIARQLFEGGLLTTGESTAAVQEIIASGQRDAEQAIIDEEVPQRYHDLLRHYFGQLENLTEPSSEDDTETSE